MRLLAIGDIHSCATALETLLEHLDLHSGDRVVSLGDYINKGPDANKTLNILIDLFNQGLLTPLLGNHELKLIRAGQKGKARIGGQVLVDQRTLASYGAESELQELSCIPKAHWQFVQQHCRKWLETENHIFIHATLDPNKPLPKQSDKALFWNKLYNPKPHFSGKTVICGHTPQKSGNPLNVGHTICLDTAASQGQWLTCLDVYSGQVWQTNQRGEIRLSTIDAYRSTPKHHGHIEHLVSYLHETLKVR